MGAPRTRGGVPRLRSIDWARSNFVARQYGGALRTNGRSSAVEVEEGYGYVSREVMWLNTGSPVVRRPGPTSKPGLAVYLGPRPVRLSGGASSLSGFLGIDTQELGVRGHSRDGNTGASAGDCGSPNLVDNLRLAWFAQLSCLTVRSPLNRATRYLGLLRPVPLGLALSLSLSLSLTPFHLLSLAYAPTRAHARARTHARTHAHCLSLPPVPRASGLAATPGGGPHKP
jgi:hypothetical protein